MRIGTLLAVVPVLLAVLFGCDRSRPPEISFLDAEPDSIHQGGVVKLICVAEDPDGGALTITWQAGAGTVFPDIGDSVEYQAPGFDAFDTVVVEVTDDEGDVADSSLVITVAEGLCGGRPDVLAATDARVVVADSLRVFFKEDNSIRWVTVTGADSGVVVEFPSPTILGPQLAGNGPYLYCFLDNGIEDEDTLPLDRLVRVSKDDGTVDTLLVLQSYDTPLSLAGSAGGVFVSWWEGFDTPGDSLRLHLTFLPTGGDSDELVVVGTDETEQLGFFSLQFPGDAVYFLATAADGNSSIRAYDMTSRQQRTVLDVDGRAGLLVAAGDRLFWTEPAAGRIGMVTTDGTDPQYVQESGGSASGVDGLVAIRSLSEHLVFWTAEDDLRGMVVETGTTVGDLEQGIGKFRALTANDAFLFYVWDNGSGNKLYRLFIR